jgi:arylsulfatase A-like enzyme
MTGRYPFRYGLQTAVIPSVSAYGLDTTEWLMPQCLKEAGYKTAIIGKWQSRGQEVVAQATRF